MDLADFSEAGTLLAGGDEFLLTTHLNNDADGLSGCLAMRRLLAQMGKKSTIVVQDEPTEQCAFLEGWEQIRRPGELGGARFRRALVLDCPTLERIGAQVSALLEEDALVLNIDHHKDNQRFGAVNLVAEVSSTCEFIYHLAVACKYPLDVTSATQLYTGILFDTGGFRFSLTTPTTFAVAGQLAQHGILLDRIASNIFGNRSLDSIKLLGRAIDSLELCCEGRVALLHLDHEDLRQGTPEDVVNYGLMVRGVEVAVLLKEQEPERYRVSLRSREQVDVSRVAARFNGGGHARASGCRLEGRRQEVRDRLLEEIAKYLS